MCGRSSSKGNARAKCLISGMGCATIGDESLARHLIARGDEDPSTCLGIGLVHRTDLVRLVDEHASRPQRIGQIVTARLQLRGETAIDGMHAPGKQIGQGGQMYSSSGAGVRPC